MVPPWVKHWMCWLLLAYGGWKIRIKMMSMIVPCLLYGTLSLPKRLHTFRHVRIAKHAAGLPVPNAVTEGKAQPFPWSSAPKSRLVVENLRVVGQCDCSRMQRRTPLLSHVATGRRAHNGVVPLCPSRPLLLLHPALSCTKAKCFLSFDD